MFIGSDPAGRPVTVAKGAYVAAGSTVTEDVPAGALAIGAGRQRNIEAGSAAQEKVDPYIVRKTRRPPAQPGPGRGSAPRESKSMCGIVGYIGPKDPVEVLVEGLRRLEYRGYDSAGVAVVDDAGEISIRRAPGKLRDLEKVIAGNP